MRGTPARFAGVGLGPGLVAALALGGAFGLGAGATLALAGRLATAVLVVVPPLLPGRAALGAALATFLAAVRTDGTAFLGGVLTFAAVVRGALRGDVLAAGLRAGATLLPAASGRLAALDAAAVFFVTSRALGLSCPRGADAGRAPRAVPGRALAVAAVRPFAAAFATGRADFLSAALAVLGADDTTAFLAGGRRADPAVVLAVLAVLAGCRRGRVVVLAFAFVVVRRALGLSVDLPGLLPTVRLAARARAAASLGCLARPDLPADPDLVAFLAIAFALAVTLRIF